MHLIWFIYSIEFILGAFKFELGKYEQKILYKAENVNI